MKVCGLSIRGYFAVARNFPLIAVWLVSTLLIAGCSASGTPETSVAPKVAFARPDMNRFQKVISDLAGEWKSLIHRTTRVAQSKAPASVEWPAWTAVADISPESNQQFLADNANAPGVVVLPDGLQYRIVRKGTGKSPTPDDLVTVAYRGSLIDGTVFDETKPGETVTFPAGRLIEGWVEALLKMKEGGEWRLFVPANLGYGEEGDGGVIPPNQTLVFDVELLTVDRPNAAGVSPSEQTAHLQ